MASRQDELDEAYYAALEAYVDLEQEAREAQMRADEARHRAQEAWDAAVANRQQQITHEVYDESRYSEETRRTMDGLS